MKQLSFKTWGGKRKGAGRPRIGKGSTPHRKREKLTRHQPVHITLRASKELGNLRAKTNYQRIRDAFRKGREKSNFRLVHFSVQRDHVHLLIEADDARALSNGLKGLQVRIARAINKLIGRTGRVFTDRYHAHVLKTPREVRHALAYVLLNAHKHFGLRGVDPCSSGSTFDGWRARIVVGESVIAAAQSWLLRVGWRRLGLIALPR